MLPVKITQVGFETCFKTNIDFRHFLCAKSESDLQISLPSGKKQCQEKKLKLSPKLHFSINIKRYKRRKVGFNQLVLYAIILETVYLELMSYFAMFAMFYLE